MQNVYQNYRNRNSLRWFEIVHFCVYLMLTLLLIYLVTSKNIVDAVEPSQIKRSTLDFEHDFNDVLLQSANLSELMVHLKDIYARTPLRDNTYKEYALMIQEKSSLLEGLNYLYTNDSSPAIRQKAQELIVELDTGWLSYERKKELVVLLVIASPFIIALIADFFPQSHKPLDRSQG